MKLTLFIITLLFIVSCNQITQIKTNQNKPESNPQLIQSKKYLSNKELFDFVNNAKTIELNSDFPSPFDTLDFNKVIAYDFDGKEEGPGKSIVDKNTSQYASVIIRQKELKIDEIQFLIDFLSDKRTYGEVTMACFEPHLGFVFYKDHQIKYVIDVCMDCNYLISTTELPASVHKKMKFEDGTEYGLNGFSFYGKKKIIKLSKKLELDYGKILMKK